MWKTGIHLDFHSCSEDYTIPGGGNCTVIGLKIQSLYRRLTIALDRLYIPNVEVCKNCSACFVQDDFGTNTAVEELCKSCKRKSDFKVRIWAIVLIPFLVTLSKMGTIIPHIWLKF